MSVDKLKNLYTSFNYPGSNNHEDFFNKAVYPRIKHNIFTSILEVGCGTGEVLKDISNKFKEQNITAIDFTKKSLEIAKKNFSKNDRVHIKEVDILDNNLNKIIGKFDFIHCQGVLHHLQDPEKGIANLKKCLNDNGILYIWVYFKEGRREISDIKEIMNFFSNKNYQDQLRILKNILNIRTSVKRNNKFKRYLKKKTNYGILSNLAKVLILIEEFGLYTSIKKIIKIIKNKYDLKNISSSNQTDIGLADEYLNPLEHFFSYQEFIELVERNDLEIFEIIDGISQNIYNLGSGNLSIEKEILDLNDIQKNRLIELLDKPRGIGFLIR